MRAKKAADERKSKWQSACLLVEDECLIRLWLANCLLDAGFDVIQTGDGDQALALQDTAAAFDLLITDIHMPCRADGNAVAIEAKRRHPRLPVIYATGRCESLRNELAVCDALVRKPYASAAMMTTVQRLLDIRNGAGWPRSDRDPDVAIAIEGLPRGERETLLTMR